MIPVWNLKSSKLVLISLMQLNVSGGAFSASVSLLCGERLLLLFFWDLRGLFEGGAVRFLEATCHMNDMLLRVVLCCVMSCALSAAMAV